MIVRQTQDGGLAIWVGFAEESYRAWCEYEQDVTNPHEPSFELNKEDKYQLVFEALRGPEGPPGVMGPMGTST